MKTRPRAHLGKGVAFAVLGQGGFRDRTADLVGARCAQGGR